jgi:hypothetical protein
MSEKQKGLGSNFASASRKLIQHCPVCNTEYRMSTIKVLDYTEDSFLVYFLCDTCKSGVVASIVEMPFGMVGSGLVTDLGSEEVLKFHEGEGLEQDDVLKVHEILRENNFVIDN